MDYREFFKNDNQAIKERYDISMERIKTIRTEKTTEVPFREYFQKMAAFIEMIQELVIKVQSGDLATASLEELQVLNQTLYEDVAGENYQTSYANPTYAATKIGREYGQILSFLYTEIRGMIVYAYESRLFDITIINELFIEIYNKFEEAVPDIKSLEKSIYWYMSDYSDVTLDYRIRECFDSQFSFAVDIIMEENLEDLRYLYKFGEYITKNQLETASHLNTMPQEKIELIAATYTEGYRIGFVNMRRDLSKKKTVNIRYSLGFERVIRAAIINFRKMGLEPLIYRGAVNEINKGKNARVNGYYGASPNPQYEYDHKMDAAIYFDKQFADRKLAAMKKVYEQRKQLLKDYAGPALVEIFGEVPFVPVTSTDANKLSEKQQKVLVGYRSELAQMQNEYIKGDETSYTIVAFPVPEIGSEYEKIFEAVIKINTLDSEEYKKIQQYIIDALDQGRYVRIKGKDKNRTDLTVALQPLAEPKKQSNFENCTADVNIPVGEVFTSPQLTGTNGILHVSKVYLNDLEYKDLSIEFKDGMIVAYTCENFEEEEDNQKYIKENVLYHQETLPMGEFAIGTNTTAYVLANQLGIVDRLPILIAEKMGPHFAVGDTCYSWSEDTAVYNPDGKEIVARDNEVSILRKEDAGKAYFNCHTDITIPYDEISGLEVIKENGERISIIKNGRFILLGTEALNNPFL
jgi:Leucyl aminopeptidase (aminopeptidase T)